MENKENSSILSGRRVKFAGKMQMFGDHATAKREAEALGAVVDDKNVTAKLWALIRGRDVPIKQARAARHYGVAILNEFQFVRKVAGLRPRGSARPSTSTAEERSRPSTEIGVGVEGRPAKRARLSEASTSTVDDDVGRLELELIKTLSEENPSAPAGRVVQFSRALVSALSENFLNFLEEHTDPSAQGETTTASPAGASDSDIDSSSSSSGSPVAASPKAGNPDNSDPASPDLASPDAASLTAASATAANPSDPSTSAASPTAPAAPPSAAPPSAAPPSAAPPSAAPADNSDTHSGIR